MNKRPYDSTVARIAGNILSGIGIDPTMSSTDDAKVVFWAAWAVEMARAIVAETQRTEPEKPDEAQS